MAGAVTSAYTELAQGVPVGARRSPYDATEFWAISAFKLGPNDVVDVHFIGHSRGSVVISQALLDLQKRPLLPLPLKAGYMIMTMLDPHPANNLWGLYDTAAVGKVVGTRVWRFQRAAKDPNVIVPSNVQQADDYFQRTKASPSLGGNESAINLWGEPPALIEDRAGLTIGFTELTNRKLPNGKGIGHSEVVDYYMGLLTDPATGKPKLPPEIEPFKPF
jgi:hypothetical protein